MSKIFKFTGLLIISSLFILVACSKKKSTEPQPPTYKWTILGYFDGNNPEDEAPGGYSYVIRDLQELEETGSSDSVQIVVMLGSTETGGNCRYYHVEKHTNEPEGVISSTVLQDVGKKDMSDYTTLRDFVGYTMQNYPAEHYMLIINDHGKGWKGLCSDNVNGSGGWMSLPDLSSALLGFEFDIIWLYSPNMATTEVAYQIKDRAEYLIASQLKNYPDNIMGSSYWLPELVDNPLMNVRLFVMDVIDGIDSAAYNISPEKAFHAALIHLAKMPQLAEDLSNLGKQIIDSTESYWNEIWNAWELAELRGRADSEYVDLRDFSNHIQNQPNLNLVIKNGAAALEASVDDAVLLEKEYPLDPQADYTGGLSIYLPWDHNHFDSLAYEPLDFSETNWRTFISALTQSFSEDYAGAIDIRSNPAGAVVFLDSINTGYTTNVVIHDVLPGLHSVKLVKPGYKVAIRETVSVMTGYTTIVYVNLVPGP
jgi:hypothetical protein